MAREKIHNPYDVVMKRMVEADPLAFLHFVGLDGSRAELFDAELSTISPAADYILRVHDPDYLAHFEFLSTHRRNAGSKMLMYDGVAHYNYGLPVESAMVLLRQSADGPGTSGIVESSSSNIYKHHVLRLWEVSPEVVLNGPTALLPLAPLTRVAEKDIPSVVGRMEDRLRSDATAEELWTETLLLLGLKFNPEQAHRLLRGVIRNMRESTTYQEILLEGKAEGLAEGVAMGKAEGIVEGKAEGKAEGERLMILKAGARRFGPPDDRTRATLEGITSPTELERLFDRLFEVESWGDFLR